MVHVFPFGFYDTGEEVSLNNIIQLPADTSTTPMRGRDEYLSLNLMMMNIIYKPEQTYLTPDA